MSNTPDSAVIVDSLHLDPQELALVTATYPGCQVKLLSNSHHKVQKYQVTIAWPHAPRERYFECLVDSGIAMSSSCFVQEISRDPKFRERMRTRLLQMKVAMQPQAHL